MAQDKDNYEVCLVMATHSFNKYNLSLHYKKNTARLVWMCSHAQQAGQLLSGKHSHLDTHF